MEVKEASASEVIFYIKCNSKSHSGAFCIHCLYRGLGFSSEVKSY